MIYLFKSISLLKPKAEQKVSASTPWDKVKKQESAIVLPCIANDLMFKEGRCSAAQHYTHCTYTEKHRDMLTQWVVTAKLSSGRESVGGWLQFPSVSCFSYLQEVHKEVADPRKRQSSQQSCLLHEELCSKILRLSLQEVTARAECCFLSCHCSASSLSSIS